MLAEQIQAELYPTLGKGSPSLFTWRVIHGGTVTGRWQIPQWAHCVSSQHSQHAGLLASRLAMFSTLDTARAWLSPQMLGQKVDWRHFSHFPSGCVCPTVDSHVLSVPGSSLLYCMVCPVPALHGCDCRTAKDTHNNGTELDDHCRASPYFWGKFWQQNYQGPEATLSYGKHPAYL